MNNALLFKHFVCISPGLSPWNCHLLGHRSKINFLKNRYFTALLLFLIVCTLYLRATHHQFVVMDDGLHVAENPYLSPPTPANLKEFWKGPYQGLYIPVTYHFWALLTWIGGPTFPPAIYHTGNILLHASNAVLAFFLLLRLAPSATWVAFLSALFFAAHPAQVESVAWVSGTKDTLSGCFALLCLLFLYREKPSRWSATLFFILAALSKPSTLVLPLVVIVLNTYWLRKPWKENWLPGTWAVLALPILYLTRFSQPEQMMRYVPPLWGRLFIVGDTVVFYLSKVLFPLFLVTDYARHPKLVLSNPWGYIGTLFLITLVLLLRNKNTKIKVVLSLFVLSLLPVLGIVPFFFQFFSTVADRYLYLPLLFAALGLSAFLASQARTAIVATTAVVLFFFMLLTKQQIMTWRNDEALFSHLVSVNPHSLLGHNNLGTIYENQDRYDLAGFHYEQALKVYPDSLPALYNLGRVRGREGKHAEAIALLEKLLSLEPRIGEAHYTLGIVYREAGDLHKAVGELKIAANMDSKIARNHYQLAVTLVKIDKKNEARRALENTLALDPKNAKARALLATL